MLEEEAERFEVMATAAGVADVRSMLVKIYDRLDAHANSQTASNSRAETAFGTLLRTQSVLVVSAVPAATRPPESRPGSAAGERHAKRAKRAVDAQQPSPEPTRRDAPATPTTIKVDKCPLVHDWGMPDNMMTQKFNTEPFFLQLANRVKMCQVSAGYPGIFGSFACSILYEKGLLRTA